MVSLEVVKIEVPDEFIQSITPFKECSVCEDKFDPKQSKPLYVNYGGTVRKNDYCSDVCRDVVLSVCGAGRAAIKKKDLRPTNVYMGR